MLSKSLSYTHFPIKSLSILVACPYFTVFQGIPSANSVEMEAVLRSINREEHRTYMFSLRAPRSTRIEARHRVLMLKDMPFRDDTGKLLPFSFPSPVPNAGNFPVKTRKRRRIGRLPPLPTARRADREQSLDLFMTRCEDLVGRHRRGWSLNTTIAV